MASQPSKEASTAAGNETTNEQAPSVATRRHSTSQDSEDSQTAAEFIQSQMQLEADAREALPYSIENCTKPLGPLRQSIFACLTCNPPPKDPNEPYEHPAGVCYACQVQCHGDHTLVEIFNKRNFTCDCGTTRFPETSCCSLRINSTKHTKGDVHSEPAEASNKYNHNFRNRFCGCACDYDPFQQKGTMFQCLGLGTHDDGGCGEDWWHPECVMGLGPGWHEQAAHSKTEAKATEALPTISEDDNAEESKPATEATTIKADEEEDDEPPMPPGFPKEDEFEGFICYKCVEAYPWIKRYAGAPGFLPPVFYKGEDKEAGLGTETPAESDAQLAAPAAPDASVATKKRKAEDDDLADVASQDSKRIRNDETEGAEVKKNEETTVASPADVGKICKAKTLPPAPAGRFSLFFTESFRDRLCRCDDCFPLLQPHQQLLEEEETYEPPVSDDGSANGGTGGGGAGSDSGGGPSHGSGSLYDRGESALRNVDRVRAIEGVMAYNHLKDKLKPFFQQFAESGQAISAEDIKTYFAKLRGDSDAIREAGEAAKSSDNRREQSGY